MKRLATALLVGALLTPLAASAQLAVAAQAGTIGLGGSVIYGVAPNVNVRGTFGFIPMDEDFTADDIDWTVDIPTFILATVDLYPTGFFHVSGGGLFVTKGGDISVDGTFTGTQTFGNNTYNASEVGTLMGTFSVSSAMPYVGIGFGNPVGRTFGLMVDLGVGFGTVPEVSLGATGPIASDATFISDLNAREAEIQDDIPTLLKYYPVLTLALSFGIG